MTPKRLISLSFLREWPRLQGSVQGHRKHHRKGVCQTRREYVPVGSGRTSMSATVWQTPFRRYLLTSCPPLLSTPIFYSARWVQLQPQEFSFYSHSRKTTRHGEWSDYALLRTASSQSSRLPGFCWCDPACISIARTMRRDCDEHFGGPCAPGMAPVRRPGSSPQGRVHGVSAYPLTVSAPLAEVVSMNQPHVPRETPINEGALPHKAVVG